MLSSISEYDPIFRAHKPRNIARRLSTVTLRYGTLRVRDATSRRVARPGDLEMNHGMLSCSSPVVASKYATSSYQAKPCYAMYTAKQHLRGHNPTLRHIAL
ncbi:hypothetical protein E2C01_086169 [Portunus trituberculatus]|uniref:Uncharacterized protein n=1 Tax=Portunus trituberculatus TaxID=210409 RepID=A0A5B7J328_PORTR|nr:hypothetical protein [Portunus trituberculatus]